MSLTLNSFDSNSINTLFSSIPNTNRNSTGLESVLSDYSSLKAGSYGKLLKAYYSKVDKPSAKDKVNDNSKNNLSDTKSDAKNLLDSANALLDKSSSLWNKVSKKDEDGNEIKEYDKDAIYSSVSKFVKNYNSLVDSGQKSNNTGVLTQVAGMVSSANSTHTTLAQVGITVDSKNHLNINEDFFKTKADMSTVKSLFTGNGSFASKIAAKASSVNSYSSNALSAITGNKSYTSDGIYKPSSSEMINAFETTM